MPPMDMASARSRWVQALRALRPPCSSRTWSIAFRQNTNRKDTKERFLSFHIAFCFSLIKEYNKSNIIVIVISKKTHDTSNERPWHLSVSSCPRRRAWCLCCSPQAPPRRENYQRIASIYLFYSNMIQISHNLLDNYWLIKGNCMVFTSSYIEVQICQARETPHSTVDLWLDATMDGFQVRLECLSLCMIKWLHWPILKSIWNRLKDIKSLFEVYLKPIWNLF